MVSQPPCFFVFIRLITFKRVNSSRSFSSKAFVIVYTSDVYIGIVIFCNAFALFCVFFDISRKAVRRIFSIDNFTVRSFTLRNASLALSIDSRVVLNEYVGLSGIRHIFDMRDFRSHNTARLDRDRIFDRNCICKHLNIADSVFDVRPLQIISYAISERRVDLLLGSSVLHRS